jgi:predicted acylesterase/phospholipase RssA
LFGPGRKRVLALDGGGVRGAISVAFLERIEELLAQSEGRDVRLGDAFDLVGGTSTGAIIAGALALGYSTAQVKDRIDGDGAAAAARPCQRGARTTAARLAVRGASNRGSGRCLRQRSVGTDIGPGL